MNRGSEWRKWDLHIHTPGTAKNDHYGNSDEVWERYIDALEKSDVTVFGITDYFSISNYIKVKEYQKQDRLKGKFLLPNVEMRIYPVTDKSKLINIHAIFDPFLDVADIEREFFRQLQFTYNDASYSCIDNDLAKLGRIVENNPNLADDVAIKKGIDAFAVSYEALKKVIDKAFFKGHVIIALSNGSKDGVTGILNQEGNMQPLRKEITRMSDIILSGNPGDVEYFSGAKTSVEEVVSTYGSLKPCIIGSDAHSLDKVGVFPNDRITWIKADPTFEGLKQILFEPKERVRISDAIPDFKYDYNIIDHVVLNTAGVWNQTIPLNQNLNTIIGGRSTGKSTLLASMAAKFQKIKNDENYDFIKGLSDNVHVFWRDGLEADNKEIEYFTQNEIANIISRRDSDKLFLEILISLPNMREAYEKFKADEAAKFASIQAKVSLFFEKRRQYNEKNAYVKTLGDKEGIKREIEKFAKERDTIQRNLTDKKELLERFQIAAKELADLRTKEVVMRQDLEILNLLSSSNLLSINPSVSWLGLTEDISQKVSEEIQKVLAQSNSHLQDFVKDLISKEDNAFKALAREINEKQNASDYQEGKKIFAENKNLSHVMEQISNLSKQILLINKESQILEELSKECKTIASDLLNEHLSYLDMMNSIASVLRIQHDNITLSAGYELKKDLEEKLNECISLRSASMNALIVNVIFQYQKKTKDSIKECLKDLLNKALRGEITFKNGYDVQSFISMILSGNWFSLQYSVDYEGDNLSDMSPGKRSFVVLKLLLDFSDKKCPILIDQPEDNLDNRAIYNELVKYVREKKKERQIILVTHNPNIVVGADSEEVIVANQNGKNAPNDRGIKFQYVHGSLENTSARITDDNEPILYRCGIREHVCDILEGGENAFRDRENKYGFFKI
ncbi:TrlF family AAA-like ATPase [Segatella copri]|uniref:TrlF family AAA-like ATPase n=1 Tax=Segatella copri TaxID=165179 RepID=UPI002FF0D23F